MPLNNPSIQQQIFNAEAEYYGMLKKPNPPTEQMIKRAQFVDKTYQWTNARIRSGN